MGFGLKQNLEITEKNKDRKERVDILYGEAANDPEGWEAKLNTYNKARKSGESLTDSMRRVSSAYTSKSNQYKKSRDNDLNISEEEVRGSISSTIDSFEPDESWDYPHHENLDLYKSEEEAIKHLKKSWGDDVDFDSGIKQGKETYFPKFPKKTNKGIQEQLKQKGYDPGAIDGKIGPNTKEQIKGFQKDNGLKVDGIVGKNTWRELLSMANLFASNAEAGETGAFGLERNLGEKKGFGLKQNLDPVADPRDELSFTQKILTSKPVEMIAESTEFFSNIQKSFKRGQMSATVDQAKYLYKTGKLTQEEVKSLADKQDEIVGADPIKGKNIISNAVYSVAGMLPAMIEGTAEGLATGGMAGLTALAGGVTAPAALPMFVAGNVTGSMSYWFRQGSGDIYYRLKENNGKTKVVDGITVPDTIPDSIAQPVSDIAGSMYAAIEFSQVDKLIPGSKEASKKLLAESLRKTIQRFTVKYGVNWVNEVGEEGLQEIVLATADEVATHIAKGLHLPQKGEGAGEYAGRLLEKNKEVFKKVMLQGWDASKEAMLPMVLLMLPGAGIEGARVSKEEKMKGEVRKAMATRVLDEVREEAVKKDLEIMEGTLPKAEDLPPVMTDEEGKKIPLEVGPKEDKRKFNKGKKKSEADLVNSGKISSVMRKVEGGVNISDEIANNFAPEDRKFLKKRGKKGGIVEFTGFAAGLRERNQILGEKSDMEIAQMVIDQEKGLTKDVELSVTQHEKLYAKWKEENPEEDTNQIEKEEAEKIEQEVWDEEELEEAVTGGEEDREAIIASKETEGVAEVGTKVDVYEKDLAGGKILEKKVNEGGQEIFTVLMDGETKPIEMLREGFEIQPQEKPTQKEEDIVNKALKDREDRLKEEGYIKAQENLKEGKYSIYKAKVSDKDVFLVQEGDKRGIGDSIYDTRQEAEEYVKNSIRINKANKEYKEKVDKEQATKDEKKRIKDKTLNEFLDTQSKNPMERGRLDKILRVGVVKNVKGGKSYSGRRIDVVEEMVKDGYFAEKKKGEGHVLTSGDETYFRVTKAEHDAANYFAEIEKKSPSEKALIEEAKKYKTADGFVKAQGAVDESTSGVYWHGSVSGDLRGGKTGLHVGTKEAATIALEARIGIPADGKGWTGNREYGKTLLAGKKSIQSGKFGKYRETGFNTDIPEEDFYPTKALKYPDGTETPMTSTPRVEPFRIKGKMSNSTRTPHEDFKANGYMAAQKKKGTAKSGYFYTNMGEDEGSISATVPSGTHLEPLQAKVQLTDIWNKAHETVQVEAKVTELPEGTIDPLIEEAKKHSTFEDFYKKYIGSSSQYGEYSPELRLGGTEGGVPITELGIDPEETVTIYRGIDDIEGKLPREINDGDFVTTDFDSALSYTGSPEDVVSKEVKAKDLILEDEAEFFKEDPFFIGAEYVYTTKQGATKPLTKQQLTDIWNKAQGGEVSLEEEAKKYGYEVKYIDKKPKDYYGKHFDKTKTIEIYTKGRTQEQIQDTLEHEVGHVVDYTRRGIVSDAMGDSIKDFEGKLRAMNDSDIYFRYDTMKKEAENIRKEFPKSHSLANTKKEIYADAFRIFKKDPAKLEKIAPSIYRELLDFYEAEKAQGGDVEGWKSETFEDRAKKEKKNGWRTGFLKEKDVFQKSTILEHMLATNLTEQELQDVFTVANGLPNESRLMWAISQKPNVGDLKEHALDRMQELQGGEVAGIKTKAQKLFASKEPTESLTSGVFASVSKGVSSEDTSGNLTTPDGRTVTPEELADISQKVSDSVSGADTIDAPPPADAIEGVTPEEPEIPALGKIQGFMHQIKYWLGTKEERWQVGLGAEKGRQIFELIRYFDRASALVKAQTEKRNKKMFFKIDKATRKEIFDVLKGIQAIDENGTVEFGALQPAGDFKVSKEEGEGVKYEAGEVLEDGRIVGRQVDEGVYATYRVYNTEKRYTALIASNPKAKGIIESYFALNEDIEQTILGIDLPAFSTQIMQNQYKIKSMHPDAYTYVPGVKKEERIFSKIKNIFKSYTPSGRMRKTGRLASTGLEEKDILKALTIKQQGFTHEYLYNNMVGDVLAIVLEPIEGGVVKDGYSKININHPRIAAITDLKADLFLANGINPDELSLYQYPSFIDSEFDISTSTPVKFADPRTQKAWELSKDISREMGRAITTNYLIKPSTANRNFVSGFEQFALKPLTHFYEGLLGGGFNPLVQDVAGLFTAPFVQEKIPDELLGGVFVSDLTNKKSMFHYPLMPFRAIEFYFKRASAVSDLNAKMMSDFHKKKKSGEIPKKTKYKQYKEENMTTMFRDMFQTISDNADSVTYDYWNKPRLLELLPKPMIPFPNYAYHKARLYLEYSPISLAGKGKKNHPIGEGKPDPKTGKRKRTWSETRRDIAKSLAGMTAWTIAWQVAAKMSEERERQMEELALKRMEWKFDTSGRIEFYADEDVALWVRAYDQPFIGDMMYWREIMLGREDFSSWVADALSLGPLLKVPALLIGLKNKYERYKPTSAAVGEQVAGWIPFGAYLRLIRITADDKKRKTYSNDYNAFRNFIDPIIDTIPGASKALPPSIPTRGVGKDEIRRFNIPEEYIKVFFLNVKRVDKKEYEEWFIEQVYGGKAARRQKNLDKKLSDKEINEMLDYWSAP